MASCKYCSVEWDGISKWPHYESKGSKGPRNTCQPCLNNVQRARVTKNRLNPRTPKAINHCFKCQQQLPLEEFHLRTSAPNGVSPYCKACTIVDSAQRRTKNKVYNASYRIDTAGLKYCNGCKKDLLKSSFTKRRSSGDGLHFRCRDCTAAQTKRYRRDNLC